MALVLTITTGRVAPARVEAFQVTFQTLLGRASTRRRTSGRPCSCTSATGMGEEAP